MRSMYGDGVWVTVLPRKGPLTGEFHAAKEGPVDW
jgi:hypothetical protein